MGLIAKDSGGGDFTPAPPGMHRAVCAQIIDIGHQFSKFYGKESHKILIGWELADEVGEDGKRLMVWKRYTLSLSTKAALYGDLISWRGVAFTPEELDGFDLKKILGAPCQLNVVHQKSDDGKKTYANVQSVNPLGKGMEKPKADKTLVFDIDSPDMEVFGAFSENLQKTIQESTEWRERNGGSNGARPALAERNPALAAAIGGQSEEAHGGHYEPIEEEDIPF